MIEPTIKQKKALANLKEVDESLKIRWSKKTGAPVKLRGNLKSPEEGDPEEIAKKFLTEHNELFAMDTPQEEVELKKLGTDPENNQHLRFRQLYKGVPVFGRQLIVHMDRENAIKGVNGKIVRNNEIDLPNEPKISSDEALKIALGDNADNKEWADINPRLQVLRHENENYLTWHVTVKGTTRNIKGQNASARWEYFIDALTGNVVWRYNNLKSQKPSKAKGKGFYSGNVSLNTIRKSTKYELEDQTAPGDAHIYTYDAKEKEQGGDIAQDSDNKWTAPNQGALVDCHVYTRKVHDYFYKNFKRNSFDNKGSDMYIYAHVSKNWANAMWNGDYVEIGDGDGVTEGPLCTLDIVAHEWTHAVTDYTANLIYNGESGALNESMSDVFAALIDGDWLHGEDSWFNKDEAPACRNLKDPTNGGKYNKSDPIGSVISGHQPGHMADKFTVSGACTDDNDYCGVHINSGIMNKAAYLIATGDSSGGSKVCKGVGKTRLGKLYYHALTHYLTPSSDFNDMREAIIYSLDDLYQKHANYDVWRGSIKNAFAAVGVGEAVNCN
ncbi:M4 family metallopeptidase [Methanobacterium formicicum]|uniref:M4 family metallopeptidase n=1 Tax=Methanobacterium formicicum TaxID=2162 RepID=UPI0024129223|nr:M4 family metallopeptidase [Methanobacterium formicicum]MDG3548146.1 M4 family metallopeptidase [Methanobacterium formicicum]